MTKILRTLIYTILFLLNGIVIPSSFAQNWNPAVTTVVHTSNGSVTVTGDATIDNLKKSVAGGVVTIPSISVAIEDLSASVLGVMSVLRGKKFLDADAFPEMAVNDVTLYSNHVMQGTISIKGKSKVMYALWTTLPFGKIGVEFNVQLSDFDIAHKVLFFSIEDKAEVKVEMENPFDTQ